MSTSIEKDVTQLEKEVIAAVQSAESTADSISALMERVHQFKDLNEDDRLGMLVGLQGVLEDMSSIPVEDKTTAWWDEFHRLAEKRQADWAKIGEHLGETLGDVPLGLVDTVPVEAVTFNANAASGRTMRLSKHPVYKHLADSEAGLGVLKGTLYGRLGILMRVAAKAKSRAEWLMLTDNHPAAEGIGGLVNGLAAEGGGKLEALMDQLTSQGYLTGLDVRQGILTIMVPTRYRKAVKLEPTAGEMVLLTEPVQWLQTHILETTHQEEGQYFLEPWAVQAHDEKLPQSYPLIFSLRDEAIGWIPPSPHTFIDTRHSVMEPKLSVTGPAI